MCSDAIRCVCCKIAAQYCCCSWASLTDQLVRKVKDSLGINTTMKTFFFVVPVQTIKKTFFSQPYSSTSIMLEALHGVAFPQVIPAATVTTDAKPHGQQQLARDVEVERAVMGQRCRPQSFGNVQRCNPLCLLLTCLLYTSPSPRDKRQSRMPSSA